MKAKPRSTLGQAARSHSLSPVKRACRVIAQSAMPVSFQCPSINMKPPSSRWKLIRYFTPLRVSSARPR